MCFSFLRLLDTLHANPQLSCDFSRAGTPVTAQLNSTEVLYVGTLTLRYPDTRLYRQVCEVFVVSVVCVVAAGL